MLYAVLFIISAIVLIFLIPSLMLRFAIAAVLKEFRKQNAVSPKNAKSSMELGIKPQTFIDRLVTKRDYKPHALQMLIQAETVQVTEDGRLYLREDKLASTRWARS
ncbi:MAG: hypothetical protein AB1420_00195 [Bacillota bacterium]